jgi:hypothetical protein
MEPVSTPEIIDGFGLWTLDFGQAKSPQPMGQSLAIYIYTDVYSCM